MKTLVAMALLLSATMAHGDPSRLSPNMKKSDCQNLEWRDAAMCEADYYQQQLLKLRSHYRQSFKNLSDEQAETCDRNELLKAYDATEAAWDAYGAAKCELECHCVGPCGTGHSMCYLGCRTSHLIQRVDHLTEQMKSSLSIWGCPMSLLERVKILHTPGFTITLTATCELGSFDCEDVHYQGTSRRSGKSLELHGKRLRNCDNHKMTCAWAGYELKNEGTRYRIDESGALRVVRIADGSVLVSEQGTWENVRP